MTQLNTSPSQFSSSHFLKQLFSLANIQLSRLESNRVCTNLSQQQLGGVDCEVAEDNDINTSPELAFSLIVSCQAMTLHKLYALQQDFIEQLRFLSISPAQIASDNDMAVVIKVAQIQPLDINSLNGLADKHRVELNVLKNRPVLSQPGLLLMDMDSTLIDIECIDEIAKLAGVGDKVSEVTELAMQGKLDFAESLQERVSCLVGVEEKLLEGLLQSLPFMPGTQRLVDTLKSRGWRVAVVSGGFTFFTDAVKQRLGLDYALSNQLDIEDGKLTGKVVGEIVDAKVKADTLSKLQSEFGIPASQTIAMGDGANDLLMMERAAMGVAYKAKPVVVEQADAAIRYSGLDQLLYLLE